MPEAQGASSAIQRLPTRLINQIAAGEVITRPAAAVKELVENSLDAGAARIEVTVQDDALSFSVRDDGRGLAEADLHLAIERYATSKIRELEDLTRLTTRGFRGEALAAISAVARLEILSRPRAAAAGWRLKVSGGVAPEILPAGAPEGTTVTVRDLFFNTPVRLKFLKNAVAEWGHILQTLIRQSLTRPDVAFAIRWRGKPYLDLGAGQPFRDRLAQVLPSGAGADLIDVDATLADVRVHGAVTGPRTTRRDRRHQFFFVNERPIVFRPLPFALEEAYRGLIMTQQYPLGALLIEMPGEMVDVNVHPTKEEVRFHNDALVSGAVHRAVVEALRAADIVPRIQVSAPGANLKGPAAPPAAWPRPVTAAADDAPPPSEPIHLVEQIVSATPPDAPARQLDFIPGFGARAAASSAHYVVEPHELSTAAAPRQGASEPEDPPAAAYAEPAAREEASLIARLRAAPAPPRAVAQVGETYILAEAGPLGMLILDQHAAHEKILFLQFMREAQAGRPLEIQPLMIPHTLEVAPAEAAALESLLPALKAAGFDVEPFGGGSFIIQSLPVLFERLNVPAFLRDLIDDVGQGDLPRELNRLLARISARAACRAAVKAGDELTLAEMQRLVDELLRTEEALRCPHGRPTVLLLTREQIDRQFGRI